MNNIERGNSSSKKEGTPFKDELKGGPFKERLKMLEQAKGRVIRIIGVEEIHSRLMVNTLKKEWVKKIESALKTVRALFDELENAYHINVAPTEFIVGKDEGGEAAIYIITEKIDGENLVEMVHGRYNKGFVEQLDSLYASLAKYILDKYRDNQPFLCDIFDNFQYAYGKKAGDNADLTYLVDVDPYFSDRADSLPVSAFANAIKSAENSLGGIKFEKARKILHEFLDLAARENPPRKSERYLENIRRELGLRNPQTIK